ncbi:MAG: trigger factor [Pseudomonadota bacterium]
MKSVIEEINSVQRRIKVSIPGETVNKAFQTVYSRIQKQAKIPGFRPGKAPISMIKKMYGNSIANDVVDSLVKENLFQEIGNAAIRPVAPPVLEVSSLPVPDTEFVFSAILDILPEIKISGGKELEVSAKKAVFEESQVQKELELLASRNAKSREVTDPNIAAEKGNLVQVSHKVSVDGETVDSMAAEKMSVKLGVDEIHPELEAALIGLKVGELKKVSIVVAQDFEDSSIAGKTAEFELQITGISVMENPSIDDEFAKDLNFDSLADLEKRIRESIEVNLKNQNKRELDQALLTALRTKNTFDVPPAMVDEVVDSMITEAVGEDKNRAKELAKDENVRKSFRDQAKMRVQNSLLLWELAKLEELKVEADEIVAHVRSTLGPSQEGPKTEKYITDVIKQFGPRIQENILLEKALEVLRSSAKITYI